jgi:hypothetical protein
MTRPGGLELAGVVVIAAVVAFVAARALSSDGQPAERHAVTQRARTVTVASAPTATSLRSASAPSGSEPRGNSAMGAVDAAVAYLALVDDPTPRASASADLRAMTLPPLTMSAERAVAATKVLAGRLGAGGAGFVRGWSLGWRVLFFAPGRARAAIWTMGTVASPAEVIAPDWSTTTCVLRWTAGGWKVASAQTRPGPTPPSPGSGRAAVAAFVRSASSFQAFSHAA